MTEDWPAPESLDDAATSSTRRPAARSRQSYALRQATVLLAVLVAAAAVVALVVSWGDDEVGRDVDVPVVDTRRWDAVVLVDPMADRLVVAGSDGVGVAAGATGLDGLLDVGVEGVVVVGLTGTPSVDGLGVVDLATSRVEMVAVAHDRITRLGDSALLVAADAPVASGSLQLVDIARRRVTELVPLAGAGAVVLPDEIRASPDGRHLAFTDLSRATTVVLDVATGTTATAAGAIADLSIDRVATISNRGQTVLVDLADLRGTRLGTVETPPLAGMLITGPTEAVAVTRDGIVLALGFADGSAKETARLAAPAPLTSEPVSTADGASSPSSVGAADSTTSAVVLDVGIVAARQRLAVTLPGELVLVDTRGAVAATIATSLPQPRLDAPVTSARCVHVVGSSVEPSLLVDATTGIKLATVTAGTVVTRSADGCVAAVQALGSAVTTIVGEGIDLEVADPVLAAAPDATAVLLGGTRPRIVVLDDQTEIALPRTGAEGTFALRDASD